MEQLPKCKTIKDYDWQGRAEKSDVEWAREHGFGQLLDTILATKQLNHESIAEFINKYDPKRHETKVNGMNVTITPALLEDVFGVPDQGEKLNINARKSVLELYLTDRSASYHLDGSRIKVANLGEIHRGRIRFLSLFLAMRCERDSYIGTCIVGSYDAMLNKNSGVNWAFLMLKRLEEAVRRAQGKDVSKEAYSHTGERPGYFTHIQAIITYILKQRAQLAVAHIDLAKKHRLASSSSQDQRTECNDRNGQAKKHKAVVYIAPMPSSHGVPEQSLSTATITSNNDMREAFEGLRVQLHTDLGNLYTELQNIFNRVEQDKDRQLQQLKKQVAAYEGMLEHFTKQAGTPLESTIAIQEIMRNETASHREHAERLKNAECQLMVVEGENAKLKQEKHELEEENAKLRKENDELRMVAGLDFLLAAQQKQVEEGDDRLGLT